MHKLLNLMLLVTLIVTACFVTGCGNTDDDWKTKDSDDQKLPLSLTVGISQVSNNTRASSVPQSITINGVIFEYKNSDADVNYYAGALPKASIDSIKVNGAVMVYNGSSYTIGGLFFYSAYYEASNVQPTAKLVFAKNFTLVSAETNGKALAKENFPKVTPIEAPDTKVKVELSADQQSVIVTVPAAVGTVSEFTAWTIIFYDNTVGKNKTFTKGEYDKYYDEVPSNGNTLRLFITSAGKELMTKDHKYTGTLATLKVKLTDGTTKDLDVSQCTIADVIWNQ